jgi:N-acetylmuramoyl-L-alanine amidase
MSFGAFSAAKAAATLSLVLAAWLLSVVLLTSPVDVALDPGHSVADGGSSSRELTEYHLTLDLAQRVRTRLEAAGTSVRLTREDHAPLTSMLGDLTERTREEQAARILASSPSRVYVSLHFNGGPVSLRGTETYFNPDRAPEAPEQDYALAQSIHNHVLAALASEVGYEAVDRGIRNDLTAGKPYGHFFSLRGPSPSVLLEALFLSNPTEAALLREDSTLEALAAGCAQGILEYLAAAGD